MYKSYKRTIGSVLISNLKSVKPQCLHVSGVNEKACWPKSMLINWKEKKKGGGEHRNILSCKMHKRKFQVQWYKVRSKNWNRIIFFYTFQLPDTFLHLERSKRSNPMILKEKHSKIYIFTWVISLRADIVKFSSPHSLTVSWCSISPWNKAKRSKTSAVAITFSTWAEEHNVMFLVGQGGENREMKYRWMQSECNMNTQTLIHFIAMFQSKVGTHTIQSQWLHLASILYSVCMTMMMESKSRTHKVLKKLGFKSLLCHKLPSRF